MWSVLFEREHANLEQGCGGGEKLEKVGRKEEVVLGHDHGRGVGPGREGPRQDPAVLLGDAPCPVPGVHLKVLKKKEKKAQRVAAAHQYI